MDFIESEGKVKVSVPFPWKTAPGAPCRGNLGFLMRTERMILQKHFIGKCSLSLPSQIFFPHKILNIKVFSNYFIEIGYLPS